MRDPFGGAMEDPKGVFSGDSSSSTYSLFADSTSADISPAQTIRQIDSQVALMALDHDSESDVSMPVETDDEDDEFYGTSAKQHLPEGHSAHSVAPRETNNGPKKRRLSTPPKKLHSRPTDEVVGENRKRQRANGNGQPQETSSFRGRFFLPAEVWYHIFSFCPPRVLGKLLQVNKLFNAYLDPSNPHATLNKSKSASAFGGLSPDAIWAASRRIYILPGMQIMPAPLQGKSELDMWKICCGSTCQFCSKKAFIKHAISLDKWHAGPGVLGVVPVFSLGLRSCGGCLEQKLMKEIDLMISLPSPLMAALPFVFMTNEFHVVSISTLQTGQPPSVIKITKYYSKAHVDEIKKEFEDVKLLGTAATEEWLKGLEDRGKQHVEDSSRWERWEAVGGLIKMRTSRTMESINTNFTPNLPPFTNGGFNNNVQLTQPPNLTSTASSLPQPVFNSFPTHVPPRFDSPALVGFSSVPARVPGQARHERTKEEVAGLKAARRSEIERRCMLLTPPLTAGVLAHMASFQAAIQIIQPLTDSAWEVLKPRLLSQRDEAQQRENDRIAQTRVVQERFDERREDLQATGNTADSIFWDKIQAPLRARIGGYADEIIRDGWNNGNKVSLESTPGFAAEVLVYVRKRFYAEAAKDEAAVRATGKAPGTDTPNGPFSWRLTLENMRWVFDTKVKPLTEKHRKELFLCNVCDTPDKYYGFEGVIQHFAAKHTSALSAGPVVVHWKSEWPEDPPFNPDPAAPPAHSFYSAAPSANTPYPANVGNTVSPNFGYGGYPAIPPVYTPNPHVYQESPGPYYGHSQYGNQYASHQYGPFQPPPQPYPASSQGYHAPQYSLAPGAAGIPSFNGSTQQSNPQSLDGNHQAQSMYASLQGGTAYPAATSTATQYSGLAQPVALHPNTYNKTAEFPSNFTQASQRTEEYTAQLHELARNAREIWNIIGGLKEIPGSVKVYTIIYHILARFRDTFQDDPPLSMMVEGLSNNKDMRPVRNVNGLLCKACSLGMAGSTSATQKKHFSFPQLVNHFHTVHEQGVSQSHPDWKVDMVVLPDRAKMTSVVNAPGMDDKKLTLFTVALPEILAAPEPIVNHHPNVSDQYMSTAPDYQDNFQLEPSQDNHEKYYTKQSEAVSTDYGPNEYDPRHPADLPTAVPLQDRKVSQQYEQQSETSIDQIPRHQDGGYLDDRQSYPDRHYIDASHRPVDHDGYGLPPLGEGRRYYLDEPVRYRDAPDVIEYRPRQELATRDYQEAERFPSGYRLADGYSNSRSVQVAPVPQYIDQAPYSRQVNDAAMQQNKVFEVVAQLSRHTQHAREQAEPGEVGSEDGEFRMDNASSQDYARRLVSDEAADAAERFLNEFQPGEIASRNSRDMNYGSRPDSRLVQRQPEQPYRHSYQGHSDDRRIFVKDEHVEAARPTRDYAYEDRYAGSVEGPPSRQDRSPELVDQRYKMNNTIYREDRQGSRGPYRPQTRFARYESARLENERVRSRSPVYVKTGPTPTHTQYRERSPAARPLRQESHYGSQPPPLQHAEQLVYDERPRRQESHHGSQPPQQQHVKQHVYEDRSRRQESQRGSQLPPLQHVEQQMYEDRPRRQVYREEQSPQYAEPPQYAEAYEFVRVVDPQGDYMIRRPVVRREVVGPVYGDEVYAPAARQQPVYESRAQGEEYDPRHPEPPIASAAAGMRYR